MQILTSRFRLYVVGIGILLSGALAASGLGAGVSAVVDNDPDCDNVAIIRCGAFNANVMREKASQGDVPRIYNALGVSQDDLRGNYVDGIVWRDGRVTVGGKTVATGAMTAGRNFGGTPIAGTNAGIYSTSRFATEGQTAFVRMVDGKFDFAVIKACGNPVRANPTPPPTPEPQPEPEMIKVCVLATWEIKTIKKSEFDSTKHTKDLDKCRPIKVCELATYKIITIKKGEFDKTKHSRDLNDCKKPSTPSMIKVCELATKNIIEIKESEFDSSKHSKDLNQCAETETPQVLAATGPETLVGGLFGASALGYSAYSYLQSRRELLSKVLKR